jgi:hypothetical protein
MVSRMVFTRSRRIPFSQHNFLPPHIPHPDSLNPPRLQAHQHSTNNINTGRSQTTVNGHARGVVLVR